ncbi:MAG: hypothetical protein P1U65_06950 [Minwuia sp.]|nr:hypothetical protein [Minwuia sp.]
MHVTDFDAGSDNIELDVGTAASQFSDLTVDQVAADVIVPWGTTEYLTLLGTSSSSLNSNDFPFI